MLAIQMTDRNGNSYLLPAFNDRSKDMTFDNIEDAEANLAVCKSATEKDDSLRALELTFEIVDYEQ